MSASKFICNMAENQEQLSFQSEDVYIVFSTQVNGTRYLGSNCGDVVSYQLSHISFCEKFIEIWGLTGSSHDVMANILHCNLAITPQGLLPY